MEPRHQATSNGLHSIKSVPARGPREVDTQRENIISTFSIARIKHFHSIRRYKTQGKNGLRLCIIDILTIHHLHN